MTRQTYEDGAYVTFTYTDSGALAHTFDSETGITTSYTYDYAGRLQRYDEKGPNGYSYSLYYSYNSKGQIAATSENTNARNNGLDRWAAFSYDADDRLTRFHEDRSTRRYTYDALGRVSQTILAHQRVATVQEDDDFLTTTYTYNGTSSQVTQLEHRSGHYYAIYMYSYDSNGNITSVDDGTCTTTYGYDSANQLILEDNENQGYTYRWTYDNAGNILTRKEYDYVTGELIKTVNYTYGDSNWGDLLTGYDGQTFTYDEIGNLTSDGTWNYTWKHGRELAAMSDGTTTWSYTYNADGMRTFRTNNDGGTYRYVYNGGELDYLRVTEKDANGNEIGWVMRFSYTPDGVPLTISYAGSTYYYITNLQGDVVALTDSYGNTVVEYTYDAWGNPLGTSGSMAKTLGKRNPLRYRGYVYDRETGLYYLQSRYYNPETGRFINADDVSMLGASGSLLGYNLFSYCENNPVNYFDITGCLLQAVRDKSVHDMVLSMICGKNPDLRMRKTCVYYNGKNWLGGFGYCDLYNAQTGEVWELKKNSFSSSCTTASAQVQLAGYTSGKLKHHPELDLVLPYQTVISEGTFDFTDGYYYYHVNYWYEGYGVLRYSYTYKNTKKGMILEFAYTAAVAIAIAYYNTKANEHGLPALK